MIPLRDNIPSRSRPIVNYVMIGLCTLAFAGQLLEGRNDDGSLIERLGMIPVRVMHPDRPVEIPEIKYLQTPSGYQPVEVRRLAEPSLVPAWMTLLTCIFLHGGWMHFLGNMWFLYIFGDNVEDRMGRLGYLTFYLGTGVAASATHLLTAASSPVPTIGASGAIAGVMGAYALLYPHAKVQALIPIFFFIHIVVLPAPVFLGIWFLFQFFQGAMTITDTETTGVAWWAHIGGFAAGALVALILRQVHALRPPPHAERSDGVDSPYEDGPTLRRFARRQP